MNPNKALWQKGDFTKIAAFMLNRGKPLSIYWNSIRRCAFWTLVAEMAPPRPSCPTGSRSCWNDIAENLLSRQPESGGAGLERLRFQSGDACDLHEVDDGSFDMTFSMFGAMFAPRLSM